MAKRKHSFLLTVCFISLVIVFVVSLVSINKEYKSRRAEAEALRTQVSQQQAENDELQDVVDTSDKDDYIEKVAREKYGYIKPGDRVYQDVAAGE